MYQFPKDERFRRLAAKLADAVTVAINSGKRVGGPPRDHRLCPFGCLKGATSCAPFAQYGALELGCNEHEASDFMTSFDSGYDFQTPFSKLGLAYRERFK